MSEPIIFISHQRIKEGKLDAYTENYRQVAEMTERTKQGTAAHLAYASDDGTAASIVHIFPDAESMEQHMHGVGELAKKAYEFMEIVSFEIYGQPGDRIFEMMQQAAGGGVTLSIKPQRLGGYIRLKSGSMPVPVADDRRRSFSIGLSLTSWSAHRTRRPNHSVEPTRQSAPDGCLFCLWSYRRVKECPLATAVGLPRGRWVATTAAPRTI